MDVFTWLTSQGIGSPGILLLDALLILGIIGFIYARWGKSGQGFQLRGFAVAIAAFFLGVGVCWAIRPTPPSEGSMPTQAKPLSVWEDFSPVRLANLQEERRPVFVACTARWDLIGNVANKPVLSDTEVLRRFGEKGVVAMEGDWTRRDPVITQFLKKHGRGGVPLYVLYGNDPSKAPKVLPHTLSSDILLECLDEMVD